MIKLQHPGSADKFFAISENLNLDSLVKAGKVIHKDLYLVPIEIGQVFRLNNVFLILINTV